MLQTRAGALACKEIRICKFCAVNNMDMDSAKRLGQLVNPFQRDAGLGYSRKDAVHKKKGAADIALVKRVLNHMREHLKDEASRIRSGSNNEFASTTATAALCCKIGPRSVWF